MHEEIYIYKHTLTVEHYQLSDTNTRTLSNEKLETECKLHHSITCDHGRRRDCGQTGRYWSDCGQTS